MAKKIFRYSSRTVLLCIEIAAAIAVVILLAGGLLLWRVASGPFDVGFARNYIQEALHDPVNDYDVTLERVVLEWPNLKGPLMLDLKGISLIHGGQQVLDVEGAHLGLSRLSLLAGHIEPVSILLSGPTLRLLRTKDNRVRFSLEDETGPDVDESINAENPLMRALDILSRPAGSVDERSPLDHLQNVEIKGAGMIMEDHVLGMTWYLRNLDLMFSRDNEGLAVKAGLQLPGGRDQAATIQAEAVYARNTKDFRINLYLQDFDPRTLSRKIEALSFLDNHEIFVNGTINLTLDQTMNIESGALTLYAEKGTLGLPDVYKEPLPYQELAIEADYDRTAGKANMRKLAIKVQDVVIEAAGLVTFAPDKIIAPVMITIADLPQEKITALWPQALDDKPVKKWLTERLSLGKVQSASVSFDVGAARTETGWQTAVGNVKGDFAISDMKIDYRAPLMPAEHADGHGTYENDTLDITIDKASIGDMTASKGHVIIDKIAAPEPGTANITLHIDGPLPTLFKYIAEEPINLRGGKGEKIGIDTARVKGTAALDVNVSFPTIKDLPADKVKVKVSGMLDDTLLPEAVKTLDLTGGPLKLAVADGMVALSGSGKLDGRPVKLDWQQYLDSKGKPWDSQVKAEIDADEDLRAKLGIKLTGWIEGTMPVKVVYTEFEDKRAEAVVEGNATPLRLMIKPFDYEKPPGIEATAKCKALLAGGALQEIQDLAITTPDLRMNGAKFVFDHANGETVLRRGKIPKTTLGETDAAMDFEIGPADLLKVNITGSFLDARPFLKKRKDGEKRIPYKGPPVIASVDVGRMRTQDTHIVEKAKLYLDLERDGVPNQLEMDAVAGNGKVTLRLKPDAAGKMAFRMEADDAGATLRAFDVYKNVMGGKLLVTGLAPDAKNRRLIKGAAQLNNFTVINAPALAQLVGAIGVAGLPQLLSGEGLSFSRLESEFTWQLRPEGDLYTIKEGRTSGSSLGLTFDGTINKAQNVIDVNGNVVPVSELNTLVSSIPLIGTILSGGSDAVFAATYTITGPADKPTVSVNPLAVLAPGIIRRILFEE